MSVTVKIVYAINRTTAKIGSVPLSCSVLKLRKILMQINKMDSYERIRIVYKGQILSDTISIGSLIVNGQSEITLYVSGISTLSKTTSQKAEEKEIEANNIEPPKSKSQSWFIFLLVMILFIIYFASFLAVKLVYFEPSEYGLLGGGIKLHCSKKSVLYGILFIDFIITLLFIFFISLIKRFRLLRYIFLFFLSLLPNFDINDFRATHGLEPFQ